MGNEQQKSLAVQGDRGAEGMDEYLMLLGQLLSQKSGWEFSLGAYGKIPGLLAKTGVRCVCHDTATMGKESKVPVDLPNVTVRNCKGWGGRLDEGFLPADAFACFSGSQGTVAHLVPFLAHVIKGDLAKEKRPRHVALIGWKREKVDALYVLMDMDGAKNHLALRMQEWCRVFDLDEVGIKLAVDFLTAE